MKQEQKVVSPRQFAFIIISFLIGSASLFVPESIAGRDAWISTIFGAIAGLLPLFIILHLNKKFKGLTIIQYSELLLGKFIGKLLGLIFIVHMFIVAVLVIEDIAILFRIAITPEIPDMYYRLGLVALVTYAVFSGIECIGRLAELYVFPVMFLLLVLPFITINEVDYSLMLPVLADDFKPVIAGAIIAFTFPFGDVAMLGLIIPSVQEGKGDNKLYILAYIVAAVLLLTRTVIGISVFSADVLVKLQLPIYNVFRLIEFGEFLNRLESLFIFIWVLSFFTKLLAAGYGIVLGLGQILNIKDKNTLIIPLALLAMFLSGIMFPSTGYFLYFDSIILPFISVAVNAIYPTLLLFLSLFCNSSKINEESKT